MLVPIWCAPTWRFHTELYKFLRNISTNICGLGERTDLKLGEVSSLFIFNRITISWLYPLNGFRFIYFYCMTVKTIYTIHFCCLYHYTSITQNQWHYQAIKSPKFLGLYSKHTNTVISGSFLTTLFSAPRGAMETDDDQKPLREK